MIESFKLPNITPETLTGSIVSFNDEYGGLPLKSCTSLISGYQEGSGTPSPDNVRPLHAWSGANLTACGVNLFDKALSTFNKTVSTTSGNIIDKNGCWVSTYIKVESETTYTLILPSTNASNHFVAWYGRSKNFLSRTPSTQDNNRQLESPQNAYFAVITKFTDNDGIDTRDGCCFNITSQSDNTFKTYNGNTYTFTFGQDIYQGSIDWKRGVVVATMGVRVFDGSSDETWRTYSGQRYTVPVSDFTSPSNSQLANIICDKLETITKAQQGSRTFVISGSDADSHDFMVNVGANSYDDMIDWLNANPITVAYELAEPIEIPLGGINLLTQEGLNNIFCNTGDTEVKFLKVN